MTRPARELPPAVILDVDGTLIDHSAALALLRCDTPDHDAYAVATLDAPPLPQAREFIDRHRAAGHEIVVVTARPERYRDLTAELLTRHLGEWGWRELHLFDDGDAHAVLFKDRVLAEVSQRYRVVAAIDDHPGIVDLWVDRAIPEVVAVQPTLYTEEHRDQARQARLLAASG